MEIEITTVSMYDLPRAARIAEKHGKDLQKMLSFFLDKKVSDTFETEVKFVSAEKSNLPDLKSDAS